MGTNKWLSEIPSKAWAERLFLQYSPVWMLAVGVVVVFELYEQFTGATYILFSLSIALPCFLLPWYTDPDTITPLQHKYWSETLNCPGTQAHFSRLQVQSYCVGCHLLLYWQLFLHGVMASVLLFSQS